MKFLIVVAIAVSAASFGPQEPAKPASLEARQEAFLTTLKAGEFAKAYETLIKGSKIEEKQDQVANLREQTERGATMYGGVAGWENLGVRQEKHQAFGQAILCCKQAPMYFYFVWYRPTEASPWTLINVWFSDVAKDYWQLKQ
jgi:hypothetical protein